VPVVVKPICAGVKVTCCFWEGIIVGETREEDVDKSIMMIPYLMTQDLFACSNSKSCFIISGNGVDDDSNRWKLLLRLERRYSLTFFFRCFFNRIEYISLCTLKLQIKVTRAARAGTTHGYISKGQ
jgi:hypothetical protein